MVSTRRDILKAAMATLAIPAFSKVEQERKLKKAAKCKTELQIAIYDGDKELGRQPITLRPNENGFENINVIEFPPFEQDYRTDSFRIFHGNSTEAWWVGEFHLNHHHVHAGDTAQFDIGSVILASN